MLQRVALEGIDGAGKTTVAQAMVEQLASEGMQAEVFAPYRAVDELLGEDIYGWWGDDESAVAAVGLLHQVMAEREAEAKKDGIDVLIYDRQWMTAFTEVDGRPAADNWEYFVPAALLGVAPMVAQRRINGQEQTDWTTVTQQHAYAVKYGRLALANQKHILGLYRSDADVTPQTLARNIIWDMNIRR